MENEKKTFIKDYLSSMACASQWSL